MPRLRADLTRRALNLRTASGRMVELRTDARGHLGRAGGSITVVPGADPAFAGYPALFNSRTWIGSSRYGWWEEIKPGAFRKTLLDKAAGKSLNCDVVANREHNNELLLSRTHTGTLELSEDSIGLAARGKFGPYSYSADALLAVRSGELTGMSFAFDIIGHSWSEAEDGNDLLTIYEAELFDVSLVAQPAYPDTNVEEAEGEEEEDLVDAPADPGERSRSHPVLRSPDSTQRGSVAPESTPDEDRPAQRATESAATDPDDGKRDSAYAAWSLNLNSFPS